MDVITGTPAAGRADRGAGRRRRPGQSGPGQPRRTGAGGGALFVRLRRQRADARPRAGQRGADRRRRARPRIDHARINADFPETDRNDADSAVAPGRPRPGGGLLRSARDAPTWPSPPRPTTPTVPVGGDARLQRQRGQPAVRTRPIARASVSRSMRELPTHGGRPRRPAGPAMRRRSPRGTTSVACNATTLANGATPSFTISAAATQRQVGSHGDAGSGRRRAVARPGADNDQASAAIDVIAPRRPGGAASPVRPSSCATARSAVTASTLRNAGADTAPQPTLTLQSATRRRPTSPSTRRPAGPARWRRRRRLRGQLQRPRRWPPAPARASTSRSSPRRAWRTQHLDPWRRRLDHARTRPGQQHRRSVQPIVGVP